MVGERASNMADWSEIYHYTLNPEIMLSNSCFRPFTEQLPADDITNNQICCFRIVAEGKGSRKTPTRKPGSQMIMHYSCIPKECM